MGIHAACGLWAQRVGGGECGASAGMRMEAGGSHTVRQTISNLPSNDEDDRDDGAEQVGVRRTRAEQRVLVGARSRARRDEVYEVLGGLEVYEVLGGRSCTRSST